MALDTWMRDNLVTQGYCIADAERGDLAVGLRFSTGVCLGLVVVALVLQSAALALALCAVGAVAGFAARHPFDHVWNRGLRHLVGGAPLPANPRRRRDAFKVATVWLALVGAMLAFGAVTAALVLGALLVVACAIVTATNLCLPSETFALLERLRASRNPITNQRGG